MTSVTANDNALSVNTSQMTPGVNKLETIFVTRKRKGTKLQNTRVKTGINRTELSETVISQDVTVASVPCDDNDLLADKTQNTSGVNLLERPVLARQFVSHAVHESSPLATDIHTSQQPSLRTEPLTGWDSVVNVYESQVKLGPSVICVCCGGLWFPRSISTLTREKLINKGITLETIKKVFCVACNSQRNANFCGTCRKDIVQGKIPKLCLSNGLTFPDIPECLKDLTRLEERLISPRIPFMQIRSLGYAGQCSLKGNVVNVPVSVDTSVSVLPRTFDQSFTIQIQLKRRLAFNHHYQCETIRPTLIYNAARYLVMQPLYIQEGVSLSVNWLESRPEVEDFVIDQLDLMPDRDVGTHVPIAFVDTEGDLDEIEVNPGEEETLVVSDCNLTIAPGEGQRPLPLFLDTHAEELSFPSMYCGHQRVPTVHLTYNQIAKSEARRYDRRAARVDKLLYSYKKQEILKLSSAVGICLRKRSGASNVTAAQGLNNNFMASLIQHDDGYRILATVRSSPAYWEQEKKKVMAMIRQFGVATVFFTLSAAESRWPELLVILYQVLDGKVVSEEEAINATFEEKCRLIRKDPITCARYFDHRIRTLMKTWKSPVGPFANYPIVDWYHRIEFQHRGSPHVHGMLWLQNAPIHNVEDVSSVASCVSFIDEMITCDSATVGLEDLIPLQTHHHTRTCQKTSGQQTSCRFGLPLPPVACTTILVPFKTDEISKEIKATMKLKYQKMAQALATMHKNNELIDMTFALYLEKIGLTEQEYVLILRSNLVQPKVFLKRSPNDVMINAFNAKILALHRANMDFQFIVDTYACCAYIINYINKSSKGISKLLNAALQEVRNGNLAIRNRLQLVASTFVNGAEISAQEAAYNVMGMAVSSTSRGVVYVNTAPALERVRFMKSNQELAALQPNSTDIFYEGLGDHYSNRSDELEDKCLAYVAGNYEYVAVAKLTQGLVPVVNEECNDDDQLSDVDDPGSVNEKTLFPQKKGRGAFRKRRQSKIVRYRRYCVESDAANYYRELLMLFLPWRNEQAELTDVNSEQKCTEHMTVIQANRKLFNYFDNDAAIDNALQQAEMCVNEETCAQQQATDIDEEFRSYAMEIPNVDVMMQVGMVPPSSLVQEFLSPHLLANEEYWKLTRSLNSKQRAYLMHVVHQCKTSNECFHHFVSGGAGVGKSRLITSIYQVLVRHFNSLPGEDPFQLKVLLCAPTGKAGYNIGGMTLHSAFRLPISQAGDHMTRLGADILNTVHTKLSKLKLIIIDEVSMVGTRVFHQIDARLRQIFHNDKYFGGISVLVLGDFRQLPPVGDSWIFCAARNNQCSELVGPHLWHLFSYFELTEIMRQRDDVPFANALNRMASGTMMPEDVALIQTRNFTHRIGNIPKSAIHLFRSNAEVDQYNGQCLAKFTSEHAVANAFDKVLGDGTDKAKEHMLGTVSNLKTNETCGLPLKLDLKLKVRYLLTINIDTSDGLVNGAIGLLQRIDYGCNTAGARIPIRVWLDFCDAGVGRDARAQYQQVVKQLGLQSTWTPILTVDRIVKRRKSSNLQVHRRQFPLVVAEGMTIHKSQGSTYEQVVVNVCKGMPRSSLYVACSRSTCATGLYIVGSFQAPIAPSVSDLAQAELERLQHHPLVLKFEHMMVHDDSRFTAMYHNVQSFNKHYNDIVCDRIYLACDMLFFVETWTLQKDTFLIDNYHLFARIDCVQKRRAYGICCFVKSTLQSLIANIRYTKSGEGNGHIEIITFEFDTVTFCVLYNSPGMSCLNSAAVLQKVLENCGNRVVVVGDMNINLMRIENGPQEMLLRSMGLTSQVPVDAVTTNGNTQIDWCFSNMNVDTETYESLFSYHKPLHLSWNKDIYNGGTDSMPEVQVTPKLGNKCDSSVLIDLANPIVTNDFVLLSEEERVFSADVHSHLESVHVDLTASVPDGDDQFVMHVSGTHHQGDMRFSVASRGRQCTANAATAVAMATLIPPLNWTSQTLDTILLAGDRHYTKSAVNLPTNEYYLMITDLDSIIHLNGERVFIGFTPNSADDLYGAIEPQTEDVNDLPTALTLFFDDNRTGLLICNQITVAIGKCNNGMFWLFDSHSRDQFGHITDTGASCLSILPDICSVVIRTAQ